MEPFVRDLNQNGKEVYEDDYTRPGISGFGGWLIVFSIGLILTFIYAVYSLVDYVWPMVESGEVADYFSYYPALGAAVLVETVSHLFYAVCPLVLGYLCFKQKRLFKTMSIAYLLLSLLLSTVAYFAYLSVSELASDFVDGALRDLIKNGITCLIWTLYFVKSERVRNTYVV
ncbi:DUF2569 domain-containing protein [Paenibacillus chitinolyticus]|uniref:DUF2569 domain-containing protein n=1 Tax=Paenibacillus chitinolyticus TaxID=79263 RepID=A0A410X1Q0_9BACL|nr:DUF2569 domain-containing protein [Paenibacillus chitinolyticus]MCY9592625.1 DUF2569 domain-containing protein [Paenibacillus chitinolyticus]MCY9594772.1 DUF2569 domain-containing protein [Paenibacillus chitinolyticus]QAV20539.1 DUF2569 domain-containing protein [Paenibacillus chitinolyticus]